MHLTPGKHVVKLLIFKSVVHEEEGRDVGGELKRQRVSKAGCVIYTTFSCYTN